MRIHPVQRDRAGGSLSLSQGQPPLRPRPRSPAHIPASSAPGPRARATASARAPPRPCWWRAGLAGCTEPSASAGPGVAGASWRRSSAGFCRFPHFSCAPLLRPARPALQPETRERVSVGGSGMGLAGRALRSPGLCLGGGGAGTCAPLPHPAVRAARVAEGREGGSGWLQRGEDLEDEAGSGLSVFVREVPKAGTRNLGMCVWGSFS